ncbi:hypothetical protein HYPSUDRAFT_43945 [Hypholoma sublateritium FD-334 SS-4]|uniref:Uncharacterized protein n=1 Tax=Hypholoma sublateritium (strain FD-334 SS-4) TaxID=945553 RepID=A0A0D2KZD0_HYPSF|nr:hypothetical protein HYPSUDRAFT_43945 [Hypholoma sublateritium FD-334 SS-4]
MGTEARARAARAGTGLICAVHVLVGGGVSSFEFRGCLEVVRLFFGLVCVRVPIFSIRIRIRILFSSSSSSSLRLAGC